MDFEICTVRAWSMPAEHSANHIFWVQVNTILILQLNILHTQTKNSEFEVRIRYILTCAYEQIMPLHKNSTCTYTYGRDACSLNTYMPMFELPCYKYVEYIIR